MKRNLYRCEPSVWLGLVFALALGLITSGCTTAQGEVEAGRRELLLGDSSRAVARFQRAAEMDPNRLHFSILPEGVWTYLGRAHYQTGNLPEARRALERAVSRSNEDHLAKLYLGLVALREGDRQRGLRDMESGMRGIHGWLDYVDQHFAYSFGRFWDPSKEIRSHIKSDLAMISRGADSRELIASGESVGKQIEEEIDRARKDETMEHFREGEDRNPR
jgi:tetratricopeptide (TPR) repeat protein